MAIHKFTLTEAGIEKTVIRDRAPKPHPSHNEVKRFGGGFRTAVLESLGVYPEDPAFEEKRQRLIRGCANAILVDSVQISEAPVLLSSEE